MQGHPIAAKHIYGPQFDLKTTVTPASGDLHAIHYPLPTLLSRVMSSLVNQFQELAVSQEKYLLFQPTGEKGWITTKFDDVPPWLIRV